MEKHRPMATKAANRPPKPSRAAKSTKSAKDDLHVKMGDGAISGEVVPGHGGRYVYGIIEAREQTNFGKIGIGGVGEMVYTVKYQDIDAVVSKTAVYIFDPTRENAPAH